MKIKIMIIAMTILMLPIRCMATDRIKIQDFTEEVRGYTNDLFPEISDENWISEMINRKGTIRWNRYFSKNSCYFWKTIE